MRHAQQVFAPIIGFLLALGLVACGDNNSPHQNVNANQGSDNNNGNDNQQPQFTTTICGESSENAQHCSLDANDNALSVTSPAPAQTTNRNANPGDAGTADCVDDWPTGVDPAQIEFTVFLPAYEDGDTMPLVLHSHGWGGSRATDVTAPADQGNNTFEGISQRLGDIRDEGYIVISFDQRGWGTSKSNGAQARVIDPCYETVDAMALIDWALQNLPVDMSDGDGVIGSVGGSYGGAYQMMLAAMDDRIDSIMPVATWHSLADFENKLDGATTIDGESDNFYSSLVNQEVLKNGYVTGLCALAQTAQAQIDPLIAEACANVLAGASTGDQLDNGFASNGPFDPDDATSFVPVATPVNVGGNPEQRGLFAANGMGRSNLRGNRDPMNVDVFLVQGNRDMVFDGTAAVGNFEYFTDNSNNTGTVKFMTTDGGHMLTTLEQAMAAYQAPGKPTNYQVQGDNDCGDVNMFDAMIAWLDQTLRPNTNSNFPIDIPNICIALDSDNGVDNLTNIPLGNPVGSYAIGSAATPISVTQAETASNEATPAIIGSPRIFLSLTTMTHDGFLAGIPRLNSVQVLEPTAIAADATAFLAIGIQKTDGTIIEVNEQITAIRRSNSMNDAAIEYTNLRMPLIGHRLENGDQVGLLFYRRHAHFQRGAGTTSEYSDNAYRIFGEIEIPIFDTNSTPVAP